MDEPILRVGLVQGTRDAELALDGVYGVAAGDEVFGTVPESTLLSAGVAPPGTVRLDHIEEGLLAAGPRIMLVPMDPDRGSFVVRGVTVGVQFHWEHQEDLRFEGAVALAARGELLDVINLVPLERYLVSVISSEMSASCPPELLRAHAVISRSWLLAQLVAGEEAGDGTPADRGERTTEGTTTRLIRWYDREDHEGFDVCADDHCQRYQGVTRAFSAAAEEAVRATRGLVLVSGDELCDARFSKCCGGMTELYSSAWGDDDPAYLQAFPDGPEEEAPFTLPLTDEGNAARFIEGAPPAWCHTADGKLLERLLPEIDHGTRDFYRWEVTRSQEQIQALLRDKGGIELGGIRALRPLRRGPSGRIVELAIEGERGTAVVGKELEIRRLLDETHLYSSAFTVRAEGGGPLPERFILRGAGWGHGVGLCQIGAAVMADQGHDHGAILAHYYRGARLEQLYG